MNTSDTIIAPATPPGNAGMSVIRISGREALPALKEYFVPSGRTPQFESHRLYHGYIYSIQGLVIDEVMAVYLAAPRSYTTEDTVEIHCHGSQLIVRQLLELFQQRDIRLARPGEFTYRAFVHGRLDLAQAEAVSRLIHASTETGQRLALAQVQGDLSRGIHRITDQIRHHLVFIEAWIDFPEEDLPSDQMDSIAASASVQLSEVCRLTDSYQQGRILVEGASIIIAGQPNSGKSSLLNALLGSERAIVTDIPGTTRDYLEEGLQISGIPVRLIDTAGLREVTDLVEQAGIDRSREKIDQADLVLFLVDGSRPADPDDHHVYAACRHRPTFLIQTKSDMGQYDIASCFPDVSDYRLSTQTGVGLEELRQGIADFFVENRDIDIEGHMLCEKRHFDALTLAQNNLENFLKLVDCGETLDLLAFELRQALEHLGEISGDTSSEDLLDGIFSSFCIGK